MSAHLKMQAAVFMGVVGILRAAAGGELEVKLTIQEPAGVARRSEPASGGVPLPWGRFKRDQQFAVFKNGTELPAQVVPLVVDERGYLRWVLVDTQVDLPAKGRKELFLRARRSAAKPASSLKVSSGAGGVSVDTGRLRFEIAGSKPFGLFSSVEVGGKPVVSGGEVSYSEGGKTYKASAPKSLEVEYAGPMRTTVCVRGKFEGDSKSDLLYVARITAWAGRSDVHVKYSLCSSNQKHYCYRQIRESAIRMLLAGKPADATGTADGISAGGAYVCDLYFNEDKPRTLSVEKGALVLRGVAAADKPRWLMDCSHLSSQYVIDFGTQSGGGAQRAAAARGWLHLRCDPDWYSETNGLSIGKFGTQADEIRCYQTWKWKHDPKRAPRAAHPRKMRTVRYKRYEDNHYETEQDNVECLLLMYLRNGSRSFLTLTQAWANYEMDTQKWRTDGWRWKDGGVWWPGGPYGNRPQRAPDPASGKRGARCGRLNMSKQCYCHNYGAGLAGWFCITGDRDALEAAIDSVEQNYDFQKRVRGRVPGKAGKKGFSRDFTRSCRVANAVRLVAPNDKFVVEASDFLSACYLKRPRPEPRGFVPSALPIKVRKSTAGAMISKIAGAAGMAEMKKRGVEFDSRTGQLTHKQSGAKWYPIKDPQFYHYAPLPCAMENYWQATGSEDAHDWVIAIGQGFSRVIFQPHCNFAHYKGALLVDFPVRGVAKDRLTWKLPSENKWANGFEMSGYTARFWPDAPARAYALTGEPLLKQRAYDYWNGGSHRRYRAKETKGLGSVASWVNVYGVHAEAVRYNSRTFYVHAHPRGDARPPAAVKDLGVSANGKSATVNFTAPADAGGGKVVRYQVKCSDKPIVGYEEFLKAWAAGKGEAVTNWWMAANLSGEPNPKAAGSKESFTVSGVPAGAKYFALRAFDSSSNRSTMSNVAKAR
jgi:hypothetical protein